VRVVEVDVSRGAYDRWHIDGTVLWKVYADLKDPGYQLVDRPPIPANLGLKFMPRWLAGIAKMRPACCRCLKERTAKMARRGQRMARKVKPASASPFAARAARWISGFDA